MSNDQFSSTFETPTFVRLVTSVTYIQGFIPVILPCIYGTFYLKH